MTARAQAPRFSAVSHTGETVTLDGLLEATDDLVVVRGPALSSSASLLDGTPTRRVLHRPVLPVCLSLTMHHAHNLEIFFYPKACTAG